MSLFVSIPLSAAQRTYPLAQGDFLTDADQTITPGTSKKSQYVMPVGIQTANRAITLSTADAINGQICDVIRPGTEAFTFTVKNGAGTDLLVVAAGSSVKVECYFQTNQWILSVWFYV